MACKYFHWGDPEKIKWEMPFNELMLYQASIPSFESEEVADKPKLETAHAADLF